MNPDPKPSSSDSSETLSSDSRAKKKKITKKKRVVSIGRMTCQTHLRATTLILPMTVITDASNAKISNIGEKDAIRLCATLTAKFLTTAYKSKIIRFKMDEDPLQRRVYFLTFVESLEILFSQYTETCEVILDDPKIGGNDVIEDYAKKAIINHLHANIDVHSRRLIAEFPKYGIKCIEKLPSHCANMTFSDKIRYARTFQQVTHKGGDMQSTTSRGFRMNMFYQFQ